MAFEAIPETDEQYALLSYDKKGNERTDDRDGDHGLLSRTIISRVAIERPSHIFFFIHGWKGDLPAARTQYNSWIKALFDRTLEAPAWPGAFEPLWLGLHWPSLPFGDEEFSSGDFDADDGGVAPDRLRQLYMDRLDLAPDDAPVLDAIIQAHQKNAAATELPASASRAYLELARKVGYASQGPSGPPDVEGAPFDPEGAFQKGIDADSGASFGGGGSLGGILSPLRQLSYWSMKKRARRIGESGMHSFVTELMKAAPRARVHLMGHSFGTIVVSGILGGPDASHPLPRQVDSVALVQGAVSLWAFGESVHGKALKGYFNPWLERRAVRGPVLVSRSIHDRAVGLLYPWASALSFTDGSFDVDDEDLPLYGAIGKYGMRAVPNVVYRDMLDEHGSYNFEAGTVCNLEASRFIAKGRGISGAHSDIAGPQVAHALWQAALV
jgi:hypothetical protein